LKRTKKEPPRRTRSATQEAPEAYRRRHPTSPFLRLAAAGVAGRRPAPVPRMAAVRPLSRVFGRDCCSERGMGGRSSRRWRRRRVGDGRVWRRRAWIRCSRGRIRRQARRPGSQAWEQWWRLAAGSYDVCLAVAMAWLLRLTVAACHTQF
jgi:hypothetical protein